VVDDAAVVRESIGLLMPRLDVVAQHGSVEEAMRARHDVDLLVLDLHLANAAQPDVRQGIAAIRACVARGHRVCVFSAEERRFVLAACVAAGAAGAVSKSSGTAAAEQAFLDVAGGQMVVPQAVIGLIEVLERRDCLTVLSERQREVLHGRARGLSYREMARQLYASEATLRGYWQDVTRAVSAYLQSTVPADVETALGLAPGDLLDYWPEVHPDARPDTRPDTRPQDGTQRSEWWRLREGRRPRPRQNNR
jgi:DNA-binding NarL/FixJ family response regulator